MAISPSRAQPALRGRARLWGSIARMRRPARMSWMGLLPPKS